MNSEYKECPNCKAENAVEAKFCVKCGTSLEDVEPKVRMLNGRALQVHSTVNEDIRFLITSGSLPEGYQQSMTIMAESIQTDGTTANAWDSAMDSLRNVFNANKLDGIVNMRIVTTTRLVNGQSVPAITVYGDGVVIA
ncbi:zinc ribbon domain-containing protein [Pediococcus argentinicus]|uniref:DZANK-type domain-containing protein n=1 Tax=Pediococcus argentinicus TaxID=480391 RepID=A0A0R2NHI6_9LACO|nr:zinc ribbon domain-containing protein [Pediococcus argentinicus]KRO22250.1 hypothetical protein IV88_GL001179 [Pediococcus argentinicus]NKZ23065.1 zinc ribbon domain-containing protein [Pediococcus argentinicus]GEP20174.1 hypothetical protein LSA03_15580 [Pediococcus argentinicus]